MEGIRLFFVPRELHIHVVHLTTVYLKITLIKWSNESCGRKRKKCWVKSYWYRQIFVLFYVELGPLLPHQKWRSSGVKLQPLRLISPLSVLIVLEVGEFGHGMCTYPSVTFLPIAQPRAHFGKRAVYWLLSQTDRVVWFYEIISEYTEIFLQVFHFYWHFCLIADEFRTLLRKSSMIPLVGNKI